MFLICSQAFDLIPILKSINIFREFFPSFFSTCVVNLAACDGDVHVVREHRRGRLSTVNPLRRRSSVWSRSVLLSDHPHRCRRKHQVRHARRSVSHITSVVSAVAVYFLAQNGPKILDFWRQMERFHFLPSAAFPSLLSGLGERCDSSSRVSAELQPKFHLKHVKNPFYGTLKSSPTSQKIFPPRYILYTLCAYCVTGH